MIPFSLLLAAGQVLLTAGIFLVSIHLSTALLAILTKFWHRTFQTWANRRLREMGILQENPNPGPAIVDWKRLSLLLAAPLVAVRVKDVMLSPLVLAIGLAILAWIGFQQRQEEHARINEDAESVALQLRSLISVDPSLVNALTQAQLPDGALQRALHQVVGRLRMHQPPEQAAKVLQRLPGSVTARLSALIAHSTQMTNAVQDGLLLSLEQEAHRQKLLRAKTRQTLSLVRGTIRLLQAVVAAAIGFVVLTPAWRDFFLQDIPHRMLLAVLICAAALGSLYFEYEVHQLSHEEYA